MRLAFLAASAAAVVFLPGASRAAITADRVVHYASGPAFPVFGGADSYTHADPAALGLPTGDTGFGALTPFNPPFDPQQIVVVQSGGDLTLHLGAPVAVHPGPQLGVFTNVGVSGSADGVADFPATPFGDFPQAMVSVSSDGVTYVPLSNNPITFDIPSNVYTDTSISNFQAPLGTHLADFTKPFTGAFDDFGGKSYAEILTLLNGSAGGTWLDLSPAGLATVQYVKFAVPDGAPYKLALDAVTAVPEPTAASLLILAGSALVSRRRRGER